MADPKNNSEDKRNSPTRTPGTAEGEVNPGSDSTPRVGRTPDQAEGERDTAEQADKKQTPNKR